MLRIHFTLDDIGRTRLATGSDPTWDVLLSLHKLADQDGSVVFDQWRQQVRARFPASAHWLLELAPPRGYSPDFLTPGGNGLDDGMERILSTPVPRIRADIARLASARRLSSPVQALADGSRRAMRRLTEAIREYHRVAVAPFAQRIDRQVHADLAARGRTLRHTGVTRLLTGLHPQARWRQPVLELPYPVDRDVYLERRGLLLVPSYFCWKDPIMLKDPGPQPILVFPIARELARSALESERAATGSLAALIGRTRAVILSTLAVEACTTTQLAARVGVSNASASQHATVLREAGLITTQRMGSYAMHSPTPAAVALLDSAS
ncbi:winged helix-turn-helix domain-containing protein [Actinoallomurus acanthiterrae]